MVSLVNMVTRLRGYMTEETWVKSHNSQKILSLLQKVPNALLNPEHRWLFPLFRGVKLATHFAVMPKLMSGAIRRLPDMPRKTLPLTSYSNFIHLLSYRILTKRSRVGSASGANKSFPRRVKGGNRHELRSFSR